ncbi:MAG: single-stranded DNA-binding protein [Oscillospiraceae bacterium]|nr:single-stranded DNA-binding protein [Oscillospiraceae bacterium]
MERSLEANVVRLCGALAGKPAWSHETRGQGFYLFPLEVRRLSGNTDTLPIVVRQELLESLALQDACRILVQGQLRSFNDHRGTGPRLVISVFAQDLAFSDEEDQDLVLLSGSLCRPPVLRRTPLGREICDLMLAVPRHYGRSDYLPCICWGLNARRAAGWATGQKLCLEGRLQSRAYLKQTPEGPHQRTAYEVSVNEIEAES